MNRCVLLNDRGEYVNLIVTESEEWHDPTWKLIPIPEGYTWNGTAVVAIDGNQDISGAI